MRRYLKLLRSKCNYVENVITFTQFWYLTILISWYLLLRIRNHEKTQIIVNSVCLTCKITLKLSLCFILSTSFTFIVEERLDCKTVRIFAYSSTCEQSNKRCGTRLRLARFARVRLLRHALPISLLVLRKTDCFAV